jgi:hypothetical protein
MSEPAKTPPKPEPAVKVESREQARAALQMSMDRRG